MSAGNLMDYGLTLLTKGDAANGGDVHVFIDTENGEALNIGRLSDALRGLDGRHDEPDVMRAVVQMLREHADRLETEISAI